LVSKIAGAVLESEIDRAQRTDHPPTDAWEHYMKGLKVVLSYDHTQYSTTRAHLERAVELAPDMAEAWWALGELEVMNYMTMPVVEETAIEDMYFFIEYFRKAHKLSPFHSAACGCLGYMLTAVGQPDEARAVFSQAIEAKPLAANLRVDYAIFLLWEGRYDEALENTDVALKLGPVTRDRAGLWSARSMVALARGDELEALDAINRSLFIDKTNFYTPVAVAVLYVLGQHDEAASLLAELENVFVDLNPTSRIFYVTMKPVDDILADRRQRGITGDPANIEEIFSILNSQAQ